MVRVAIVGSGPAGIYTAEALLRHGDISVDVIDRLPCPYGLVRYGVAPDHFKIKSVARALARTFDSPQARFLGNIQLGRDVTVSELRSCYDAVVYAFGAAADRRLGIDGEDLAGSVSATSFVAWYSGHPDEAIDRYTLDAEQVAVIGNGNVAVDVARVLARPAEDLRGTDVPDHVLKVLSASRVTDVHIIGRRGPAEAKFTTKELRELGELTDVDVVVDPDELVVDEAGQAAIAADANVRRNVDVVREWAERPLRGLPRRIYLRFLLRPVRLVGDTDVTAIELERTRLDGGARATGTGEIVALPVQMVVRSVGYRAVSVADLPFDDGGGVIPNRAGRVLRDGRASPGEYAVGWIKRGPTGVIGTNKSDATETVHSMLEDLEGWPRSEAGSEALPDLLAERGVQVVTWAEWLAIEEAEADCGRLLERGPVKIAEWSALLAAAARRH